MNLPNKITISRFIMAFVMILLFILSFLDHSAWAPTWDVVHFCWIDLAVTVIFIAASITDSIDGHIARSRKLITDLGKFMDPLADKFLVNSALIYLATKVDPNGMFYCFPILVILFIGRDLAVDGLRMMATSKGRVLAANIFGKTKTVMEMIVIPMLLLNGFPFSLFMGEYTYIATNILISLALIASLVSGIIYFVQNGDVLIDKKEEKAE